MRGDAPEPVAANVDRLGVVARAASRAPDWFLVDRYWAGARLKDIAALLIVNKSDLRQRATSRSELGNYRVLGPALRRGVGARPARASPALRAALADGATLLVGPIGCRQILARQRARARCSGADRRAHARSRRPPYHDHRAPLSPGAGADRSPRSSMRPGCAISPRRRASCAPPSAASSKFTRCAADCRFNDCRHLEEPRLRGAQRRARRTDRRRAATKATAGCTGCTRSCAS